MYKKKRHILFFRINNINYIKKQLKYSIIKSIKFNRNIKNINHIFFQFFCIKKKNSISSLKSMCIFSGYKRSIINKFRSSKYISNKLAKHGLLTNFRT